MAKIKNFLCFESVEASWLLHGLQFEACFDKPVLTRFLPKFSGLILGIMKHPDFQFPVPDQKYTGNFVPKFS